MSKLFKIFFAFLIILFLIAGYQYYKNSKPDPTLDKTVPNLIYIQGSTVEITKGHEVNLKDYVKAYDEYDGDLTSEIEIIGKVDVNKTGTYEITYRVKDKSGNEKESILTITVVSEKINLPLSGIKIGVDAGHQEKGNSETEPNAPNSSVMKAKTSSGTNTHVAGKNSLPLVYEYEVNLKVALYLKEYLESSGAEVIMTRETNNVNISNVERSKMMNTNNVDLFISIHCDGSADTNANGAFAMFSNRSETKELNTLSEKIANVVMKNYYKETGITKRSNQKRNDQTKHNWATVPSFTIEMGFMSNLEDAKKLISEEHQKKAAKGIANGIEEYFVK